MDDKIWQGFVKSEEFKQLQEYPTESIKMAIDTFFEMSEVSVGGDISKFNETVIVGILMSLYDQKKDSDNPDDLLGLNMFYAILREFFRYAAKANLLAINATKLEEYLEKFELVTGVEGNSFFNLLNEMVNEGEVIDDPSLPKWLDYVSKDINEYGRAWVDAYLASSAWKKRAKGVNADILFTSMGELINAAYDDYRKTPKTWTKKVIHDVLTGDFVEELDLESEEFQYVVPALSGLLTFVAEQGYLNEKKANNYKRYLAASESDMLGALEEWEAADDWESEDDEFDDSRISKLISSLSNNIALNDKKLIEVAELCDPDRDTSYLSLSHKKSEGKKVWSRKTAKTVHILGIQFAIKLWLNRKQYKLPVDSKMGNFVVDIMQVVDTLYANDLETPQEWTKKTWKKFIGWMSTDLNHDEYIQIERLLKSLIVMLSDEKIISKKTSQNILECFRTNNVVSINWVNKN